MTKITLEEQLRLENEIKAKGRWKAFKYEIGIIHNLMRQGLLDESQYLHHHSEFTLLFAGAAV
jgi:hypothetical protein